MKRYSEKWANKPDFGDQVKSTAVPLGRRGGEVIQDRSLSPDDRRNPDKIRSHIQPNKNMDAYSNRKRKYDNDIYTHKAQIKNDAWRQQGKSTALYQAKGVPGQISSIRRSDPSSVHSGNAIDQRRKSQNDSRQPAEVREQFRIPGRIQACYRPFSLDDILDHSSWNSSEPKKTGVNWSKYQENNNTDKYNGHFQNPTVNTPSFVKDREKNVHPISQNDLNNAKSQYSRQESRPSESQKKTATISQNVKPSSKFFDKGRCKFMQNPETCKIVMDMFSAAIVSRNGTVRGPSQWLPSVRLQSARMKGLMQGQRKSQASII